MKIGIGSDHAGFPLKQAIAGILEEEHAEVTDVGTDSGKPVDYPDFGLTVAKSVADGHFDCGILICGSGIGMSIVANKVPGVRAALCTTPEQAALSRRHNDANILVLAGRMTDPETAALIVRRWLHGTFEGGRHARRVRKIHDLTGI